MKRKKAPNLSTFSKIQTLGLYRKQFINHHRKAPYFYPSYTRFVLAPRTVKRQARELFQKWYDMTFRW